MSIEVDSLRGVERDHCKGIKDGSQTGVKSDTIVRALKTAVTGVSKMMPS